IVGGWRALRQMDIKVILAYGTVSQLGLITLLVGAGTRTLAVAGLGLLVAHALFKSCLFLTVGVIEHASGTRDLRKLSRIGRQMPVVAAAAAISAVSMAGLPPLVGFMAKESALEGLLEAAHGSGEIAISSGGAWAVLVAVAVGSMLTIAYSARFRVGTCATMRTEHGAALVTRLKPVNRAMVVPVVILAFLTLAVSVAIPGLSRVVSVFADTYPGGGTAGLSLWHGLTWALGLSALIIAGGVVLVSRRRGMERLQERFPDIADSSLLYRSFMRRLDRVAGAVTGMTQRGSLPVNIGTILVVFIVMGAAAIIRYDLWPSEAYLWDSPAQ